MSEYRPQDTEDTIYIENTYFLTINDIIEVCHAKWGDVPLNSLQIEHEHIQVKCFGYDQYDSSDYIDYFVVKLI